MMPSKHDSFQIIGTPVPIAGFAYGLRYPSVIINLAGQTLPPEKRTFLSKKIGEFAPSFDKSVEETMSKLAAADSWPASVLWMLAVVHHLQRSVGLPIYESGKLLSAAQDRATCCLPIWASAAHSHVDLVRALFRLIEHVSQEHVDALEQTLRDVGQTSPKSANVPRFLKAAFNLGIPFHELPGEIIQYGICEQSHWMESTFTDGTTRTSARIARDKWLTAQMLRRSGLPVPAHFFVANAESAVQAAEKLGYPVVVKPVDLDGGVAVFIGLESAENVRNAYTNAVSSSPNILVEKHAEGRDYRLVIFRDEVIAAIERIPAGVMGDGRQTVEELLAQLNADPRRGSTSQSPLKLVPLDDEARELLEKAGLQPTSIPAAGRFVRLRQAANISSGGMPVNVLDKVHPDNLQLGLRATRSLRLDLAGIDLLMPDIGRSWRETGANICEVNAQPYLGTIVNAHLYEPMLKKIVPGTGRVPTVVVLGSAPQSLLVRAIELALLDKRISVGCHDSAGVRVQGEVIRDGVVSSYVAGTHLLGDQNVAVLVLSVDDVNTLRSGLPFARYDVLVLAGKYVKMPEHTNEQNREQLWIELLAALLPGCDGRIMTLEGSGLQVRGLERFTSARWDDAPIAPPNLVAEIVQEIRVRAAK